MTISDIIARLEAASGPDRAIVERLDTSRECWIWTGKTDERGRGRVWHNGKLKLHHRAVWEILIGRIPDGWMLCHHCDNPSCANPMHMYIGDSKSNVRDMFSRRRHWTQKDPQRAARVAAETGRRNTWVRGASNPNNKLSEADVRAIRKSDEPTKVLAQRFGVNVTTIQRIRRGSLWSVPATLKAKEASDEA